MPFYKGFAILLIVLHNYFHWVNPSPGENEFDFDAARFATFLGSFAAAPAEGVNLILSYLGHYGVQIFIFLSAYGLARSHPGPAVAWRPFMLARLKKIYPAFLLAVLAHSLLVVLLWNGRPTSYLKTYVIQLTLLGNFWPGKQLSLVGPWWFFSFIFQFYTVYPLLSRAASRYGGAGLAILGAIGLVCTALLNPIAITYGQNLFFTPLGHLPVICLGMYFARTDDPRMPAGALIAAALVMVAGNWIEPLWYLMPLCMAILLLFMLQALHARMIGSGWPLRLVRYYGAISLPLFAVHGMLRGPFVELANAIGEWHTTIILGLMYLISATLAAQLMHMIERRGRLLMPRVLSS